MNQTAMSAHFFLAAAQTSAANPSASYRLLKHQMHKHTSQRGADRATGSRVLAQCKHPTHMTQLYLQILSSHPLLGQMCLSQIVFPR